MSSEHRQDPARRVWYQRVLVDTTPLQISPAFRRIWVGGVLSGFGSQLTRVAVPIQVFALTDSSLAVGMIGIVQVVPMVLLGLIGGSIADAFDRRRLVLVTGSLLALISLLLFAQAVLDLRQVWLLYVLIGIQAALTSIDQPARRTFARRLLPLDLMAAQSALGFLSFQFTLIVGPLVAGVVIAAEGTSAVYLIDAITFIAALAYGVFRLPPMPPIGQVAAPGLASVVEGLRFVSHHPIVGSALLLDLIATVFGMPTALFPEMAETQFGRGPEVVGMLFAAIAVGGLATTLLSGLITHLRRQGVALILAIVIWGLGMVVFGVSHSLWVALAALAVAGAADAVNGVIRNAITQSRTPDELLGRVNSVGFVVAAGGPNLGNARAGVVASLASSEFSAASGGALSVVGALLVAVAIPALRAYDARHHGEPGESTGADDRDEDGIDTEARASA